MSLRLKPALMMLFTIAAIVGFAGAAGAASVYGVLPFHNTGATPASGYGNGSQPDSELLQASDGNYYGTTLYGGSGLCPSAYVPHQIIGCGVIFRVSASDGSETVLYSFPYDPATGAAPDGAYPQAGLIQGRDGALYGVAADGGIESSDCSGQFGCGTLFRISTNGIFTLLHQFCGSTGCPGAVEGEDPSSHLVQAADGTLYGTTLFGGILGEGTLFGATTSGVVMTLHSFGSVGDGSDPAGALLISHDGSTLYGTTQSGGAAGFYGTVFSYGPVGLTILHSFPKTGSAKVPAGALIYGPDGLLYGTTTNGSLYSLDTMGQGFEVDALSFSVQYGNGLLLGSDGMMYGTVSGRSLPLGGLFVYNPVTKAIHLLFGFQMDTGYNPRAVLIEGKDHYLYGSNFEGGGEGSDEGTLYRVGPALAK